MPVCGMKCPPSPRVLNLPYLVCPPTAVLLLPAPANARCELPQPHALTLPLAVAASPSSTGKRLPGLDIVGPGSPRRTTVHRSDALR